MGANEDIFKHLDVECWNCGGGGQVQEPQRYGPPRPTDCDICYGTGYQVTGAGLELLGFLRRQKKRIEREAI